MKEDFGSAVTEAIRTWFEGNYPEGLNQLNESENKYTKDYFDKIEGELGGKTEVSDVTSK